MPNEPVDLLRQWFLERGRKLPWRLNRTPYSVWISEVMLQQTQVSVVIPYFLRWMDRFPSPQSLANSPWEEVVKYWEGLGYYSRAKNLYRGAQYVCERFNGKIPEKEEELASIPGLGPYTVGALLAFAFKKRAAATDGNVLRVLARYFAIEENVSKNKTQKMIRQMAEAFLPEKEPWVIAEALIELGALICKKTPLCDECPLQKTCKAFRDKKVEILPIKTKQKDVTVLYRSVAILIKDRQVLIRRVPEGQVMGGLHEFPYIEHSEKEFELADLTDQFSSSLNLPLTLLYKLSSVEHSFTRFRAYLKPFVFACPSKIVPTGYFWASKEELRGLAFSSGHKRVVEQLKAF